MGTRGADTSSWLAIVNPAAGGGRCGRAAPAALARLRAAGLAVEVRETAGPRDATRLAREGLAEGYRGLLAGGGDGTVFEVLNGMMPAVLGGESPCLGFLPLGTGNAFLRDFSRSPAEHAVESLIAGRRRETDVLVLRHRGGRYFFLNLLGFGFAADVTARTQGGLKRFGVFGYTLGVVASLVHLRFPVLPMAVGGGELEASPMTFVCVSNSRYTADMMIAPRADTADGLADVVRVAPLGRRALLRAFPSIFEGRHLAHPAVSTVQAATVRFAVDEEVPVMIDGELLRLVPESVEVLARALQICV